MTAAHKSDLLSFHPISEQSLHHYYAKTLLRAAQNTNNNKGSAKLFTVHVKLYILLF